MSQYDTGRPVSDIRLRNWPAGRANLMKLVIQQLEAEVNRTLPASVAQSTKRFVTDQVPFPLSLTVRPGFRQAEVIIQKPPGLGAHPRRQLLFYELQYSGDGDTVFASPNILQTKQTTVSIAGLGLGETISFRARIVNTFNEASVWTDTVTVTVAQSQIQQTALPDVSLRLNLPIGVWQKVYEQTYTPLVAKACLNQPIALAASVFDTDKNVGAVTHETYYGGPAFVELRWMIGSFSSITQLFNLRQFGQRTILSARPGFSSASDKSSVKSPLAMGTFMGPEYELDAGINAKIRLEARKNIGSEWQGSQKERAFQTSVPVLFTRGGQIIEVLRDL